MWKGKFNLISLQFTIEYGEKMEGVTSSLKAISNPIHKNNEILIYSNQIETREEFIDYCKVILNQEFNRFIEVINQIE